MSASENEVGGSEANVAANDVMQYAQSGSNRSRSTVWKHYVKEPGGKKCRCIHCGKRMTCGGSSGTTHLRNHLGAPCDNFTHNRRSPSAQAEKRSKRVSNVWKHVKAVDSWKLKLECVYCGFIAKGGGMSRAKAHLAGECPESYIPGCPNVPPEVKEAMVIWFNQWLKRTNVDWGKKLREVDGPFENSTPLENARQLDDERQRCDLVSERLQDPQGEPVLVELERYLSLFT